MIGIVVGLAAEARIARKLGTQVAVGGGGAAGAAHAAAQLIAGGASALISFGLAGGLDPACRPGDILVPSHVLVDGNPIGCDATLSRRLACHQSRWSQPDRTVTRLGPSHPQMLLAGSVVVADRMEKARLHALTGAAALDLESGAVALAALRHGLPFAVLRAICDPAARNLPPAAMIALDAQGGIQPGRIIRSLLRQPGQINGLLRLANDARQARTSLLSRVREIGPL